MPLVRQPVVAGVFYPAEPMELHNTVRNLLTYAKNDLPVPKAIIAPHAGYIYSGEIAANAYNCLSKAANIIKRVVLLGPAHHYPFRGIAVSGAEYFATPLGQVKVDQESVNQIISLSQVSMLEEAHVLEHSLEVHLPFLQIILKDFSIVPLVVSLTPPDQVAEVIEKLWGGDETLIIVSSDLSHYHDYVTAQNLDNVTCQAILAMQWQLIKDEQACGALPIKGLLQAAIKKKLRPYLIDLRNSGDTAGSKDQVVGYGAFHFLLGE